MLAVYTRPRDADHPLVCLDETSKQMLAETRLPIPIKPGRPARCDYEYERNGTGFRIGHSQWRIRWAQMLGGFRRL
ncbi:MAG TPA: hypothetical protein VNO32_24195 [Candidatus Acidoferrum sp.]|nr:hypothetical protein [Candidatus Acidoferrum sp.]